MVVLKINLGTHRLLVRLVGEPYSDAAVDLVLVIRFGVLECGDEIAESVEDRCDLLRAEFPYGLLSGLDRSDPVKGLVALGLGLGDPSGHHGGIGSGVGGGPVARGHTDSSGQRSPTIQAAG